MVCKWQISYPYFTPGSTQSISNSKFAPVKAVVPWKSYGGDTSTKSPPMMFKPLHPRMISKPCIDVRPPISGVPSSNKQRLHLQCEVLRRNDNILKC